MDGNTRIPNVPDWIADITVPALERNPDPIHEWLRKEAPVAFVPALGLHVASTREACREIAGDGEMWHGFISPAGGRTFGHPNVLNVNGADHKELRCMVDPALQPSEVDRHVEDLVRPIARRPVEAITWS